jgi:predicted dinucleotide-binding enzyme
VSGDDRDANLEVVRLIDRLGFAAITLGTIAGPGLVQQFGAPLVAQNLTRHG